MKCEYCHNIFTTKSILTNHQKTAKYCIKLQEQPQSENILCQGCGKSFSHKSSLDRHIQTCLVILKVAELEKERDSYIQQLNNQKEMYEQRINNQKEIIDEQKETIKELQDKLENVAITAVSRPTTTKNTQINYIQNLQPVTQEHLADQAQHLTLNHIKRGPEGYAQFALEYSLKDRVVCVDYARRKIKFKDKDNNLITDPEMSNLASKFFESIMERNNELILQNQMELWDHCRETNFDPEDANKMIEYMLGVKNGSKGEKTEFSNDFVKVICNKTVKD